MSARWLTLRYVNRGLTLQLTKSRTTCGTIKRTTLIRNVQCRADPLQQTGSFCLRLFCLSLAMHKPVCTHCKAGVSNCRLGHPNSRGDYRGRLTALQLTKLGWGRAECFLLMVIAQFSLQLDLSSGAFQRTACCLPTHGAKTLISCFWEFSLAYLVFKGPA